MRRFWMLLTLAWSSVAVAQDAGQALQQAQQQAMEQQQVMQQQMNQQQLDLINQQLLTDSSAGLAGYRLTLRTPQFKQQAGTRPGTVVLKISDRSRGASIFYTTDGWTPTAASQRYAGPIPLEQGVTVRAIALGAGGLRSEVAVLPVNLGAQAMMAPPSEPVRVAQLVSGTRLPLVFDASVSSRGQKVGDRLPVSLATDLFVDGKEVAPKGAAVDAVVTQVDNAHVQGLPGVLSLSARSLRLQDGTVVPLLGVETMEGADHTRKANYISLVPLAGLAVHGGDAVIPAGQRLNAEVMQPAEQAAVISPKR